jgi:hypothetical protein
MSIPKMMSSQTRHMIKKDIKYTIDELNISDDYESENEDESRVDIDQETEILYVKNRRKEQEQLQEKKYHQTIMKKIQENEEKMEKVMNNLKERFHNNMHNFIVSNNLITFNNMMVKIPDEILTMINKEYIPMATQLPSIYFKLPFVDNDITRTSSLYNKQFFTVVDEEFFDNLEFYFNSLKNGCIEKRQYELYFKKLCCIVNNDYNKYNCTCTYHVKVGYEQYFDSIADHDYRNDYDYDCDYEYDYMQNYNDISNKVKSMNLCLHRFTLRQQSNSLTIDDIEQIRMRIEPKIHQIRQEKEIKDRIMSFWMFPIQREQARIQYEEEEQRQMIIYEEEQRIFNKNQKIYQDVMNKKIVKIKCTNYYMFDDDSYFMI